MDLENLTDEEYFAEMKLMFHTNGWKILMLELADQAALINDVQDLTSGRELYRAKGKLEAIGKILNHEELLARFEKDNEVDKDESP